MSYFDNYSLKDSTMVDEHGYRWMKEGLQDIDFLRTRWRLRRTQPNAREYLERHANEFPWADLCLMHGQESAPPPYRVNLDMLKQGGFLEEGHCFRNSMRALRRWQEKPPEWVGERTVTYVEGLALDPTGIFVHGWIDVGGQAVDLTFKRAYMTSYFGIRFEPAWADQTMERINKYGMLHTWTKSQPHLEEKLAA